ncbi:helix-turn-helix domain-containing protein [Actinoplanes oblitus]|uniref:Helix-turn-helix domain-containing protein n=1 Tax=Actinoplanes oblitus TaxID=3040509 RepID=A0ABY8W8V8_9ACTN|nr:helix-turn-helix domain-containing protein [Actinoplanes oblitus]WIM93498.1 helix-turn-helix domain-containing protein [Actinoplanes oblitus]
MPDPGEPAPGAAVPPAGRGDASGDRPAGMAEAATWWDLQDEMAEQFLGLRHDAGECARVEQFALRPPEPGNGRSHPFGGDGGTFPHQALLDGLTVPPPAVDQHLSTAGDSEDTLPPGSRIARWRVLRGLSQLTFAYRMNRPLAWVIAVEQDFDRLDTIEVARQIADVLQVDVPLLMGRDPQGPPDTAFIDDAVVEQVHTALEHGNDPLRAFVPPEVAARSLAELAVAVRDAWQAYEDAEYRALLGVLPRLLRMVDISDSSRTGGRDAAEAARQLSQVYQVTAAVLRKIGLPALGRLAADRAVEAAIRGEDVLLVAAAAGRCAQLLMVMGRDVQSVRLSRLAATRLAEAGLTSPAARAVYGSLLLRTATAAARLGRPAAVRLLLAAADRVAEPFGLATDHYRTCFNPVTVQLCRVATAVELGDGARAVEGHRRFDPSDLAALPAGRRAAHHLALARAYLQISDLDRAGRALLTSAHHAGDEIRSPFGRVITADVLRQARVRAPAMATRLERLFETC